MSRLSAAAWHIAAGLLGIAVSVATVGVHRTAVGPVPVGLLVGAGASLTMAWALRSTHVPLAAAYALGWLLPLGLAFVGRPEGDFVVLGDAAGYALAVVGVAMVVVGITSLRAPDSSPGEGAT